MLEEKYSSGVMEKKLPPSRHSPVPSKSNFVTEKKSDFSPNKNGRQRKGAHNSWACKSQDTPARSAHSQKFNRGYGDKRQRQRGSFGNRQGEEITDHISGDVDFEHKSRKGNANHLLGFYYDARPAHTPGHYSRVRPGYKRSSQSKLYNKEHFLQASCQFVVRDTGTYKEQMFSPDALVAWEMIELVQSFATEEMNCAICRHSLYAGKITKCGHIYCWPCMLRYLSLGESNYRKCPICYDAVKAEDLRSVQVIQMQDYKVGDEIEFSLMQRPKGSCVALPKQLWKDKKGEHIFYQEGPRTPFAKIMLASVSQVREQVLEKEKVELEILMSEAEEDEVCFIEVAQEMLRKRESTLEADFKVVYRNPLPSIPGLHLEEREITATELEQEKNTVYQKLADEHKNAAPTLPTPEPSPGQIIYSDPFEDEVVEFDSAVSMTSPRPSLASIGSMEESSSGLGIPSAVPDEGNHGSPPSLLPVFEDPAEGKEGMTMEEATHVLDNPDPGRLVHQEMNGEALLTNDFFYQESSGQHIYLNTLNAKCLSMEYGGLEHSPEKIKATIVAKETISVSEAFRKRFRYLSHLPLLSQVTVVELKFKSPLVSRDVLQHFQGSFDLLAQRRRLKQREDRQRARRHEVEQKKTYGIYPEVKIPLNNVHQFPSPESSSLSYPANSPQRRSLDVSDLEAGHDLLAESSSEPISDASDHSAYATQVGSSVEGECQSPSFAQMLQAGKPKAQIRLWPQVSSNASSPLDIIANTTANLRSPRSNQPTNDDSDGEGMPVPSYATSVCADLDVLSIDEKLQKFTAESSIMSPSGGKKKKKKKEKQLLFSTSMARKN